MVKRFSICVLILALTIVFTGCNKEASIKVNAGSKFDEVFGGNRPKFNRVSAPNVVYLGDDSQNSNEGPVKEMSFEFKDLKR